MENKRNIAEVKALDKADWVSRPGIPYDAPNFTRSNSCVQCQD